MPQFSVHCHFFNCLPCLSVTQHPIFPQSFLKTTQMCRDTEETSTSRWWYLYTNQHGITVIYFPHLNSTQDQLHGITRLLSTLHPGVWQAGCEAQHTSCAEVNSEWSCTPLPHTLSQHNSKLSKGTELPLNSSQTVDWSLRSKDNWQNH